MSQQDQDYGSNEQGTPVDSQHQAPVTTQPSHAAMVQNPMESGGSAFDNITGVALKNLPQLSGEAQPSQSKARKDDLVAEQFQIQFRHWLDNTADRNTFQENIVALYAGYERCRNYVSELQTGLCDRTKEQKREKIGSYLKIVDCYDEIGKVGKRAPDYEKRLKLALQDTNYRSSMENWIVWCSLSKSSFLDMLHGIQDLLRQRSEIERLTNLWKGFTLISETLDYLLNFANSESEEIPSLSEVEHFADNDEFAFKYCTNMNRAVPLPDKWSIGITYIYNKDNFSWIINDIGACIDDLKHKNVDLAGKIEEQRAKRRAMDSALAKDVDPVIENDKMEVDSNQIENTSDHDASSFDMGAQPENNTVSCVQYKELETKWMDSEEKLHKLTNEYETLKSVNQTLHQDMESLSQNFDRTSQSLEDLRKKQLETMQLAADYKNKLDDAEYSVDSNEKQLREMHSEYDKIKVENMSWDKKCKDEVSKVKRESERTIEQLNRQLKTQSDSIEKMKQDRDKQIRKHKDEMAKLKDESEQMKKLYKSKFSEKDNEIQKMTVMYNQVVHKNERQQQFIQQKEQMNNQLVELLQDNQNRYQMQIDSSQNKIMELKGKLNAAEEEKEKLLTRLSKIAGAKLTQGNAGITDLSDQNRPMKVAEKYSELYDNEWTDALEELVDYSGGMKDDQGIAILLEIVVEAYKFCCDTADRYSQNITVSLTCLPDCQSFSTSQSLQLSDEQKQMMEELRKALSPQLIQSVEQKYLVCLRGILLRHFGKKKLVPVKQDVRPKEVGPSYTNDQVEEKLDNSHDQLQIEEDNMRQLKEDESSKQKNEEFMEHDGNEAAVGSSHGDDKQHQKKGKEEVTAMDSSEFSGEAVDTNNYYERLAQEETAVRAQQTHNSNDQFTGNRFSDESVSFSLAPVGRVTCYRSTGETAPVVTDEELRRREKEYVQQQQLRNTLQNVVDEADIEMEGSDSTLRSNTDQGYVVVGVDGDCRTEPNSNLGNQNFPNDQQGREDFIAGREAVDERIYMEGKITKREEYVKKEMEMSRSFRDKTGNQDRDNTSVESFKNKIENAQRSTADNVQFTASTGGFPDKNLSDSKQGEAGDDRIFDPKGKCSTDLSPKEHEMEDILELDTPFEKVNDFGKKCAHLCWMMRVRDPPLHMVYDIQEGSELNTDFFKHYTQSGKIVKYLVWPALFLHENGALLAKGVAQPMKKKEEKEYFSKLKDVQP